MGDRGNIAIKYSSGDEVFFYTHWIGRQMAEVVRDALKRGRERWTDEDYLARIVFCELVKGSENDTQGFGIGVRPAGDGEHPIIVVEPQSATIRLRAVSSGKTFQSYSFSDFSALPDAECEAIGNLTRNGDHR